MYQGKYSEHRSAGNGRYSRRSHGRKRSLLVLASVLVLTVAMVGGTLAYLATQTDPVVNTFTYGQVPIDIPEDFDGTTKENVRVSNTGNVDAFVRAKIVVTWKSASGEVSGVAVQPGDYTMTTGDGWFRGTDGFYYCKAPVKADTESPVLITTATRTGTAPEGYDLSIEILAQSVQADGIKDGVPMVQAIKWPVTVVNGQLQ